MSSEPELPEWLRPSVLKIPLAQAQAQLATFIEAGRRLQIEVANPNIGDIAAIKRRVNQWHELTGDWLAKNLGGQAADEYAAVCASAHVSSWSSWTSWSTAWLGFNVDKAQRRIRDIKSQTQVLESITERLPKWSPPSDLAALTPSLAAAPDPVTTRSAAGSSDSVLDVGCGTGELLRLARQAGHAGRLCGLDPAQAMLARARARPDIEWVLGTADSARWDREFDLVVMTGHAFQVLVDDARIRTSLAAIAAALAEGGRFAFETRHPLARAWERWTTANTAQAMSPSGAVITKAEQAHTPTDGRIVSFTSTYTSPAWDHPELSHSTLRFLGPAEVAMFLAEAGLVIEEQYGDWDRQPLTDASPEIITIAYHP